ncbi:hypothetical protein GPECTOR_11g328 [Gonium pectorale]|uniref:Uncharacterized protein n=1 Tax=Gonium pectorale TaxID=33097 RepID=A0A150GQ13_GONPE|nr:hypothetical protein GPECTOR_11g328 [Gonium pectorale]|eukprot:KXZ51894.1 hypothetical protein GPECTOR_11g328 [Gonium pectorale]
MDTLDQVNIEFDLVDVRPAQREIEWLLELDLGGKYAERVESGLFDIGEGLDLVVELGRHQSIKLTQGDSLSSLSVIMIVEDESALFNYPFDVYSIEFEIKSLIVDTTVEPYEMMTVDTGMILYEGELGWETHAELSAVYDEDNSTTGIKFFMEIHRSTSVKFFSMFIVILMWAISLFVFVLALNYCLSRSDEISYDVPALAVGLLFALPFVRDVQPNVPVVGATIDVFGFFWNVALVAGAAVIVLAALATRVQRNTIRQYEEAEAAGALQAQQGADGSVASAGSFKQHQQPKASAVVPVVVGPGGWTANRQPA